MTARQLPAADYARLKASFRQLLRKAGGPVQAASVTRVSRQVLERAGDSSDDHADRWACIDVVADLEAECGEPVVTRALAALAGCELRPVEPASGPAHSAVACAVSATGEAVAQMVAALADGRITQEEAAGMQACVHRAADEIARLAARIDAIAEA